jgi:hypothetical protein
MCARLGLLTVVSWLTVSSATAAPPENGAVEIPLKEVWALEMPGTRDITELEPPPVGIGYGPITDEIRRYALGSKRFREQIKNRKILGYQNTAFGPRPIYSVPPLKPAGQGFAVPGDNSLREAHAVLAKDAKPPEVLTGPVTLVFYALRAGSYVHLDKIERDGFTITLTYHLQGHMTTDSTSHFALIPLGQLPPGKYAVKIERQGETWKNSQEIVDAIICKSFQFEVK